MQKDANGTDKDDDSDDDEDARLDEEIKEYEEKVKKLKSKGVSLLDLLIYVDFPSLDFDNLTPIVNEIEPFQETSHQTSTVSITDGSQTTDMSVKSEVEERIYSSEGSEGSVILRISHKVTTVKTTTTRTITTTTMVPNEIDPETGGPKVEVDEFGHETTEHQEVTTSVETSVTTNIADDTVVIPYISYAVHHRGAAEIAAITGFSTGAIESTSEGTEEAYEDAR